MNKYLLKYKKRKQQGSANPFSTAYDYWMNKGLGGFSEFADAASEYSETVEAEDNTSFTITGSYTSGNLTIKPEIRVDSASANIYSKSLTDYTDNLASFVLAAIYAF